MTFRLACPLLLSPAGTPVTHDFVIKNDGNVALRQLGVSGFSLSSVNCSRGDPAGAAVTNPVAILAVNEYLSCTGTFLFTEVEVEKGNAAHTTQAAAVNVVPLTNVAFTQGIQLAPVAVPNDPVLEAYIHIDTCSMPQIERKPTSRGACQLVHVQGIMQGTAGENALLCGCTMPLMRLNGDTCLYCTCCLQRIT